MYIEAGIKMNEGEVALVLLSAQAEEKEVLHMRVRDSGLCSAAFQKTIGWLSGFSAAFAMALHGFF